METLEPILRKHPFFKDFPEKYIGLLTGCSSNVVFKADGQILREGEEANKFYIVRKGRIAVYIEKPQITIQTIHEGDILGWSWLIPPYKHRFSAKAVEATTVLALDGKCLREKCEKNSELGYELLKRIVNVLADRLEATRLQLLDVYNINPEGK
jgi:CRP-like cAMP-binding protein